MYGIGVPECRRASDRLVHGATHGARRFPEGSIKYLWVTHSRRFWFSELHETRRWGVVFWVSSPEIHLRDLSGERRDRCFSGTVEIFQPHR